MKDLGLNVPSSYPCTLPSSTKASTPSIAQSDISDVSVNEYKYVSEYLFRSNILDKTNIVCSRVILELGENEFSDTPIITSICTPLAIYS